MFSANSNGQAQAGPDLEEVTTEALGFLSIAGETKVRLLPSPWPSDKLPPPTSSLLSIASKNELLAAAGPDTLVICSTSNVRGAFVKEGLAENNIKNFEPQLKIPVPRVSQVVFSSDERFLTISADEGGGLAVYDVQALKQGKAEPEFQIATNGIKIRALIPNPAPENGHLVAVVLANGQLMLANLNTREFGSGVNGLVLRDGVSCVSWSSKGKQLVAGMGNGTAIQLTPEGAVKAEIPRPPQLQQDEHVSAISWLSNDTFCIIYTPTNFGSDQPPESAFMLCSRQKNTSNFTFQKLTEICTPFGMNRSPPHHFISRMREFPPHLADILIMSSTASGDVGLITCSSAPLSSDPTAANTANTYTTTSLANDSRRAQLPVSEEMNDTSPIGMALDLSGREVVKRPMPGEEIEATKTPLPALMILNNDGILSAWWFVYADSVRQGQAYSALSIVAGNQQQAGPGTGANTASPFGALGQSQNSFGSPNSVSTGAFGQSATPAFGTASTSAFGSGSSSFGSASTIGASKSAWTSVAINTNNSGQSATPSFGKPAFGNASLIGGAFGASGALGKSQSLWAGGNPQQQSSVNNSNLASPFSNTSSVSPFASATQQSSSVAKPFSPFSNTSSTSPFATAAKTNESQPLFGASNNAPSLSTQPSFGSTVTIGSSMESSFGVPSSVGTKSAWGTPSLSNNTSALSGQQLSGTNESVEAEMTSDAMDRDEEKAEQSSQTGTEKPEEKPKALFGSSFTGFQLKSSFEANKTESKKSEPDGNNPFGSRFGNILNEVESKTAEKKGLVSPEIKSSDSKDGKQKDVEKEKETESKTEREDTPKPEPDSSGKIGETTDKSKTPSILQSKPDIEPAPLPPSPDMKTSKTEPEPAPLPPSPDMKSLKTEPEPAPLPPSPKIEKKEISPAGTPPVDLGAENSSPLSSAKSSDNEPQKENTAPKPDTKPPLFAPQADWEFPSPLPKARSPPKSPEVSSPAVSIPAATPTASVVAPSDTPISATKPPIFFSHPSAVEQSPRSPSPVRRSRMNMGQRSLSSPSPPRQPQPQVSTTPMGPPSAKPVMQSTQRIVSKPSFPPPSRLTPLKESEIPEVEDLDDSDYKIQEELKRPIEATKQLAPFLAHQDYVGKLSGQGIPVQIEKIYRDITSMIDTLGLNARSLRAFVEGHSELSRDQGRDRGDLEKTESWSLQEIDDLALIQKELSDRLETDRPQHVEDRVAELQVMQYELARLRARYADTQRLVHEYKHPDQEGNRPRSLTNDQSSVLLDLRKGYQNFQKLISQAEDAVALLKARLTSVQAADGRPGSQGTGKVPTVEAVLNTISKMTRIVEEKSGDLDVLESQVKMLHSRRRAGSSGLGGSTLDEALGRMSLGNSVSSAREDRLFSTPPSSRKKDVGNGTYSISYSPELSDNESGPPKNGLRASLLSSTSKKPAALLDVQDAHLKARVARKERRAKVMALLKDKVCERGVRVTAVPSS